MDKICFTEEMGRNNCGDITVYALSTCAFCKKALKFLRENSVYFKYVYVDDLDPELKRQIKDELRSKFDREVGFPFLIIDDEKTIVGFTEGEYKEEILGRQKNS